jgi:hypothetical protein
MQKSAYLGLNCVFFSENVQGMSCAFRHAPAALGCDIVCSEWVKCRTCAKGKPCCHHASIVLNVGVRCEFRHMNVEKRTSLLPCHFEQMPEGCRKPHCLYKHMYPRDQNGTIVQTVRKHGYNGHRLAPGKCGHRFVSTFLSL